MGLKEEMAADFSSSEIDDDLFEDVLLNGEPARAMTRDDMILEQPHDDGGGFMDTGERDFKFRSTGPRKVKQGDLIEFAGVRYRVFSVSARPGHPLILTRARKEGT